MPETHYVWDSPEQRRLAFLDWHQREYGCAPQWNGEKFNDMHSRCLYDAYLAGERTASSNARGQMLDLATQLEKARLSDPSHPAYLAAASHYSAASDALRAERDDYERRWIAACRSMADLERIKTPAPSPLERARAAVVEDAMARHDAIFAGKDISGANAALGLSCMALRALSQPAETDAVREARDVLDAAYNDAMQGDMVAALAGIRDARDMLDRALAEKDAE